MLLCDCRDRCGDRYSVAVAAKVLALAKAKGVPLVLPVDVVAAAAFANDAERRTVSVEPGSGGVPDGWMGLDVGPRTVSLFGQTLATAKSVFWNGPMGVSEMPNFAAGTVGVAKALALYVTPSFGPCARVLTL